MDNIILKFIKFRENQKLTQSEFAEKIGVSRSTIAKIENGNSKISKKFLLKLEDSFPNEWEQIDNFRNEVIELNENLDIYISNNDKLALKEIFISYDYDSIIHYYLKFPIIELEKILLVNIDELKEILESKNIIFDIYKKMSKNDNNEYYDNKFIKLDNINKYIQKSINDGLPEEYKFDNKSLEIIAKILQIERDIEHFTRTTNINLKYLKSYIDNKLKSI